MTRKAPAKTGRSIATVQPGQRLQVVVETSDGGRWAIHGVLTLIGVDGPPNTAETIVVRADSMKALVMPTPRKEESG